MDQMISLHVARGPTRPNLRPVSVVPVAGERLAHAKTSYATRRVPLDRARGLEQEGCPLPGDLVLARVVELGQHQHLESGAGRRAKLWPGDEIVVAYGNRYAPDQFEALVPADLGVCDLVAGGGIAARVASRHSAVRRATRIEPIGLLVDHRGKRLNLIDWRLPQSARPAPQPYTIAVCGTSMNAGKTTVCAGLVRGFARNGLRVGVAKITGTGSGNDVWAVTDAGATPVLDFTDAGHATTFGLTSTEVQAIFTCLTDHLAAAGAQASVLELADGLLQPETVALVGSRAFVNGIDAVIFAANSAMGAKAGVEHLRALGIPVLAVGGVMTMSPLACREAAAATKLPVLGLDELCAGAWFGDLIRTPACLAIA
jgi:hypothetical protein